MTNLALVFNAEIVFRTDIVRDGNHDPSRDNLVNLIIEARWDSILLLRNLKANQMMTDSSFQASGDLIACICSSERASNEVTCSRGIPVASKFWAA